MKEKTGERFKGAETQEPTGGYPLHKKLLQMYGCSGRSRLSFLQVGARRITRRVARRGKGRAEWVALEVR